VLDATSNLRVPLKASVTGVHPSEGICTSGAVAVPPRNPRWYAVLCRPGQELRAAEELRKQGFEIFCPAQPKPQSARDRRAIVAAIARVAGKRIRGRPRKVKAPEAPKIVMVPVLRGYVFVSVDLQVDDWSTIRSTRGVLSGDDRSAFLCMRTGEPFPIPSRQIETMQDRLMRSAMKVDLVAALLEAGETVRVCDGPFNSFPGTVLRQEGKDVWLMVDIFGRSTPVQLKVGQVERAA
jgi:transcription antitermination factor NusG